MLNLRQLDISIPGAGKMKFSQLDFFTAPVSQIDSPERPFGSLPEGIKKGASVHETKA